MTDIHTLAARHAHRPLLLEPKAARTLASRLASLDPVLVERPGRLSALMRKVGLSGSRPRAFDEDGLESEEMTAPLAYAPVWMGEEDDTLDWGMTLKDGIAMLSVDTAISDRGSAFCGTWWHGYDTIDAALKTAFADDRVKGIMLHMSSPGGVVSGGLDDVTQTLRANRESAGGKPVWVFADLAASAAYWISAQADRVIAPRSGLVGSIGAVILHTEFSDWLAGEGVKMTSIQFGAQKTAGNDFERLSESARADLQAMVDQAGRDFVAAVTDGRPSMSAETLLASEARVFPAHHDDADMSGKAWGFVDEIMSEEACFEALLAHTGSAGAADISTAAAVTPQAIEETAMSKRTLSSRPKSAILASMASAQKQLEDDQDELEAIEEDELAGEGEEVKPAGEGAGEGPDAEDDLAEGKKAKKADGEGEEVKPTGEGDIEDPDAEDDLLSEEDVEMRALAFSALPEAKGLKNTARALARDASIRTPADAALRLSAARKDMRISARQDTPVRAGGGSSKSSKQLRMKAATEAHNAKTRKKRGRA